MPISTLCNTVPTPISRRAAPRGGNGTVWPCISFITKQAADGSWPETGGPKKGILDAVGTGTTNDAQVYRNTLCVLMKEVYYRYLTRSR